MLQRIAKQEWPDSGGKVGDITAGFPPDNALFYLMLTGAVCFFLFYLLSDSDYIKNKLVLKYGHMDQIPWFVFSKSLGFLLMGIVPACILVAVFKQYSLKDFGFYRIAYSRHGWNWLWALSLGFIIINLIIGRTAEVQRKHPQIRAKDWKPFHVLILILGWSLYILAYEFFFRGILFFPLVVSIGIWPAIGMNIFIYGLAHVNNGAGETIASLVFGVLFCLASLETGSFWVAAISHLAFSISGNLTAFYYNPEMKLNHS